MYVCMYVSSLLLVLQTTYRQPGIAANRARGQLNRDCVLTSRLRIRPCETGSADSALLASA